jgi:hypothetical protein
MYRKKETRGHLKMTKSQALLLSQVLWFAVQAIQRRNAVFTRVGKWFYESNFSQGAKN